MIEQPSGFHARALRVIGQDLADLMPENLAIELHGNEFVAHGFCAKSRIKDQSSTILKKLFDRVAAIIRAPTSEPDLEFVPFNRTYNADDIDRLDRQETNRRGAPNGIPDIYTLGERLRTIGKVIDAHNGRIVRIFKDLHQIVFEYQDGQGSPRKEEMSNTELYRLQQRYAAGRAGAAPDESGER